MAAPLFPFTFLILLFAAPSLQYSQYELNKTVSNSGFLQNLDNGLRGRFTGFMGNNTEADVQHGMFFISQDGSKYTLAMLAYDTTKGDAYAAQIIWKANQTREVGDGAILELGVDGNMLLKDSDAIVWQTGTQNRGVRQLEVSDRGNLVLTNVTHSKVWQTFDSPSDTLICTQVLRQGMHLSNGDYSLVLEQSRLVLFYKSSLVYKEWKWNNASVFLSFCCDQSRLALQLRSDVESVNEFNKLNVANCSSNSDAVLQNMLEVNSSSKFSYAGFARLGSDGQLIATKWVVRKQQFESCDLLRSCGSYGLCTQNAQCTCPDFTHFQYSISSQPEEGCKLTTNYSSAGICQNYTLTGTIQGIDYIVNDYSNYLILSDSDACRNICLLNDSCQAGFFQTHTNRCFQFNQVETLRSENSSYMAFFKVCAEKTHLSSSGISKNIAIILGVSVSLAAFLCIATVSAIYIMYRRRLEYDGESDSALDYLAETTLKRYTYKDLEQITKGFSVMLGMGGFGSVHKGLLPTGVFVAVKKLDGSGQSKSEFYAEMSILSRVHHVNLVQLIGFCADRSRRALIYEFMPHGSLDKWFHPPYQSLLTWQKRIDIAKGAARGMAYLHEECNVKIVHLDVKPQNILLGENFYPKVADFGLSKFIDKDQSFVMTTVRGTRGYLAPEWFTDGAINEKSDVYSFGVVLVELVAGSKPREIQAGDLWECSQSQERIFQFVDQSIRDSVDVEQTKMVVKVAALCVQHDPDARPAMSDVVGMLEGKVEIPHLTDRGFNRSISPETREKFVKLLQSRSGINSNDMRSVAAKMRMFDPR